MTSSEVSEQFRSFVRGTVPETPPAGLLSNDPTLMFTNAGVSVLKETMLRGGKITGQFIIQPSFRARMNEISLLKFDMLTLAGPYQLRQEYYVIVLSFLEHFFSEAEGALHAVLHPSNSEMRAVVEKHGITCHSLAANNSRYWVDWTFGAKTRLLGKGATIVWERENELPCGNTCNVFCGCRKYVPLGNFVVITNTEQGNTYFDLGFGIQRLASVFHNGDDLLVPPLGYLVKVLESRGWVPGIGRDLARSLDGANTLVSEGLKPSAKGNGYILRKLIRRICDILLFCAPEERRHALEEMLLLWEQTQPYYGIEFSEVIRAEALAYRAIVRKNFERAVAFARRSRVEPCILVSTLRDTFGLPTDLCEEIIQFKIKPSTESYEKR